MATATDRYVTRAGEGTLVHLGGIGVHFKIPGALTGGRLAIVEHPVQPRTLVPPHTHRREDELSYVVAGRVGVRIGDEEFEVGPGDYVWKPRDFTHTFWNPGDEPAHIVELLLPSDFERYFAEMGRVFADAGGPPAPAVIGELAGRYGLEFTMDWVPDLEARHGVTLFGLR